MLMSGLIWLLILALVSFLVTWLFTDLFHLTQEAYIGVLAIVSGAFLSVYLSWSNTDWSGFLSYQWLWGILGAITIGLILGAALIRGSRVQARMLPSAPKLHGFRLVGALLWEGLVYGIAEGLLLSVLPVLISWKALASLPSVQSWYGVVLIGMLSLVVSMLVIVIHHLGYREFRGRKLVFALTGCTPLSLIYLLTMNPLSAMLGHSILHMGAVLYGIELPPHQETKVHAGDIAIHTH